MPGGARKVTKWQVKFWVLPKQPPRGARATLFEYVVAANLYSKATDKALERLAQDVDSDLSEIIQSEFDKMVPKIKE